MCSDTRRRPVQVVLHVTLAVSDRQKVSEVSEVVCLFSVLYSSTEVTLHDIYFIKKLKCFKLSLKATREH